MRKFSRFTLMLLVLFMVFTAVFPLSASATSTTESSNTAVQATETEGECKEQLSISEGSLLSLLFVGDANTFIENEAILFSNDIGKFNMAIVLAPRVAALLIGIALSLIGIALIIWAISKFLKVFADFFISILQLFANFFTSILQLLGKVVPIAYCICKNVFKWTINFLHKACKFIVEAFKEILEKISR